jgi:membrane protein DedA with SNARE-associated domain
MIEKIISLLAGFIITTISTLGYTGVALLMAIESACIPLPSEVIMPFSGYLVFTGQMQLWKVAVAGATGCVLGSLVAYYAGSLGGRPLLAKYGKYLLISTRDLDLADRWFQRHGDITIFVGRLLPVVRTFIALPAGISRMPLGRFVAYTFVGSYIWCWGLAWIGMKLGEHWNTLGVYFHRFDALIGVLLLAGVVWYVRRHLSHSG